jgi:hypothetical protein
LPFLFFRALKWRDIYSQGAASEQWVGAEPVMMIEVAEGFLDWRYGDDLDFVDNSEEAGADFRGTDNRRASRVLHGRDQARRSA